MNFIKGGVNMDIFPDMRDFTEEEQRKFEEACWNDVDNDNLCSGCSYEQEDQEFKSCSTCIQWVDGYLTATNFKNKYLECFGDKA